MENIVGTNNEIMDGGVVDVMTDAVVAKRSTGKAVAGIVIGTAVVGGIIAIVRAVKKAVKAKKQKSIEAPTEVIVDEDDDDSTEE